MLDSEGFVSAGWVHDLQLHSFVVDVQVVENYLKKRTKNFNGQV